MRPSLLRRNLRRTTRRIVRVPCQVVRERDFSLVGTVAVDLSTGGMLVESRERILTGEEVIVAFRSPKERQWFDCTATVARVVHGRRPYDVGRLLGLRFDGLDEWQAMMLRAELHGMPPPLPKKALRVNYRESIARFLAS